MNQEVGDYLKSKAKASGDFIPIYLPSAYHTLDVLTHFFFAKKHEWFAICFLDGNFQCHAIWLEKGPDNLGVSVIISIQTAIYFAELNNIKNIILAHNHIVTSDDLSFYKSKGVNMNPITQNRRQHYLQFSEADKNYSKLWLKECEKKNFGFISAVITAGEFYTEGHQKILNNISANKPIIRGFRSNTIQTNLTTINQQIGYKKLVFKADKPTSKLPEYKGLIGYFGLSNWWNLNFTLDEQNYIVSNYIERTYFDELYDNRKFKYLRACILTEEEIELWTESVLQFVTSLTIGYDNKKDREISLKILEKAEELINDTIPPLDLHYFLHTKIKTFYRLRELNSRYLEIALKACEQQIEISPLTLKAFRSSLYGYGFIPSPIGYTQLAIVKEREKKFEEVIIFCQKALNEGWNGDWQKRIDRCKIKLSKL